jgi:hypothetical protein
VDAAFVDAPGAWEAFPPLQALATHTGALAFTGAFAAIDGFASAALACTVAAE